jgi:hypothetical protein
MASPQDRFQPDKNAPVIPPIGANVQGVQQAGSALDPVSALNDPNSEKFMVEFWVGPNSKRLLMGAPTTESAILTAYFVAVQNFPKVHTFGIWRKTGPNAEDIGDCVCFVPLANVLKSCAKELAELTSPLSGPSVPIKPPEASFEEIQKKIRAQPRR